MNEPTTRLPADERRAATVKAVIDLAAEQNPNDITTAAIANRMGLTQGAIFRHFPTKDAILQAVMMWVAERLLARVEKAAQGIASPIEALEAMFMAHIDFVAAHPGVPRMIFGELQRAGKTVAKSVAQTLVQRYGKLLHNLFEVGKAQGEIDIKLDNEAAAIMFIGSIQGLVMQSLLHGDTNSMRGDASRIFLIYKRGIQSQ